MYNILSTDKRIAYVLFQILGTILAAEIKTAVKEAFQNKTKEIKALEEEKNKLLQEINTAIDESVTFLQKSNDTEAKLGIEYMKQLKGNLQVNNETDLAEEDEREKNNTRRSKKLNLDLLDIASIFNKDKSKLKKKKMDENKLNIQKKIEQWIFEKKLENQKIQEYKDKKKAGMAKFEKCPRWGADAKKKRKSRRQFNSEEKEKAEKKENQYKKPKPSKILYKYPCCRKCCKKSYMGCL